MSMMIIAINDINVADCY